MVRMCAEFLILWQGTNAICRHSNSVDTLCCMFITFKKIENPAACEMRSVIRFFNAKNMKLVEIHCQLCDVYGEHAMSNSMVRGWVRLLNEECKNVHDDPQSGWLTVVSEDFVRAVEEKIRENRRFTITSLSLHLRQISRSLLHEIVCTLGAEAAYRRTQIETAGQCVGLPDTIR